MSRARRTVSQLAREADLDPETAALMLMEAGIKVDGPGSILPAKKLSQCRRVLGLPSVRDYRAITRLATETGLTELEARERLAEAGLVRTFEQVRLPRKKMAAAGVALMPSPQEVNTPFDVAQDSFDSISANEIVEAAPAIKRRKRQGADLWPLIGREEAFIVYMSAQDVENIHWVLVRDFQRSRDPIDPPGVRDRHLLESAVFHAQTSLGSDLKYPSIVMSGAALLHAVVHDHPFHNGNKRTAFVSLLAFLHKNGYVLLVDEDLLYDFVLSLASHSLVSPTSSISLPDGEVLFVARWLQSHIRRLQKGEFVLQFRELRQILSTYGCSFEVRRGNRINIRRAQLRTQVFYAGDGRDVELNTIHKIRSELQLDEEHGCDSDIFYNAETQIPEFINKYRQVLTKLAKV